MATMTNISTCNGQQRVTQIHLFVLFLSPFSETGGAALSVVGHPLGRFHSSLVLTGVTRADLDCMDDFPVVTVG